MRTYLFADFKALTPGTLDIVKASGVTDVVLGVAGSSKPFRLKGREDGWIKSIGWLTEAGIGVHLMPWMRRDEVFIRQAFEGMRPLFDTGHVSSLLLDCEWHWIHGGMPAVEAAELCRDKADGIRLGVTGYTKVQESLDPLLQLCDYGCPQAYGFWSPKEDHWSHNPGSEPGAPQARAYRNWSDKPIVMGVAAYWLARPARRGLPPMSYADAWRANLQAALRPPDGSSLEGIAIWSLKWLHRWSGHKDRMALVQNLTSAARHWDAKAGICR